MKKIGKRSIWISIVVATMLLTGCGNQTGSAEWATGSDAADFSGLTTEVTTEEATTEAALEVVSNEDSRPEAVPATTEIGGGKKKEETTEEKKPSTTESAKPSTNHSNNSGSASSGQSTAPKPSNSGNSGNSSSNNGGSNNSGSSNSNNSGNNGNAANNTPQHQHDYKKVIDTAAYDEKVIDQKEYDETIEHPAEYKTVPAVRCNTCLQKFASADEFSAHELRNGGWCTADGYGTTTMSIMIHDAWTETKHHDEQFHMVHHDEVYHYECSCGARK